MGRGVHMTSWHMGQLSALINTMSLEPTLGPTGIMRLDFLCDLTGYNTKFLMAGLSKSTLLLQQPLTYANREH